MLAYILFVLIKFSLIFVNFHGLTDPTDYSQTTEIIAGDLLKVNHHTSWVFQPTFATKSITISYLAYGLPVYLFSQFTTDYVYKLEYFQIILKAWVFFLSLLLDYFYYTTCYYMKCYSMSMLLYATYYVTYTIAFKPSLLIFENVIFSALISLSLCYSVLCQEKSPTSTLIPKKMGVLISMGIFTNISFLYTGFWLFLWPCIWVMTRNARYKLFQLLSFVNNVLVSFIVTSLAISTIDSIYFKQLSISFKQETCSNNLIPSLISRYLYSFLSIRLCVSGRFILTPYNAIQYYFDQSTSAHDTPTNPLYNLLGFMTSFGPIICLFSYSALKILRRSYSNWKARSSSQVPKLTSRIYWIFKIFQIGLIFNITVLSVFFFTRAYFAPFSLSTLILPISLLSGYALEYYMSKKLRYLFWFFWIIFNATSLVYYGLLHEAGVSKSLFAIQHSIIDKMKGSEDCKTSLLPCLTCVSDSPCHYHILYSHTMQPPEHFLLWPQISRSFNITMSWENEGNIDALTSKIGQIKDKCPKSHCSVLLVSLSADNIGPKLYLGSPIVDVFPHFGKGVIFEQLDKFYLDMKVVPTGQRRSFLNVIQGFFNYFVYKQGSLQSKLKLMLETGHKAFSLRIYQA